MRKEKRTQPDETPESFDARMGALALASEERLAQVRALNRRADRLRLRFTWLRVKARVRAWLRVVQG